VKLLNMIPEPRVIFLAMEGLPNARMTINGETQQDGLPFALAVDPDRLRSLRVFVTQAATDALPGSTKFRLVASDSQSNETDTYEAIFEAPVRKESEKDDDD
jgi:hypothetical protein